MEAERIDMFLLKTKIMYGINSLNKVGEYIKELKGSKILIVTDPGIIQAGLLSRLTKLLDEADIPYSVYDDVVPNPIISSIEKGAEIARNYGNDLFIAFGGGSSIDTAKGIKILLANGGRIKDYAGAHKVANATLPLIAIPTTCGTGSEVTWSTVVSDPDNEYKFAVLTTHNMPEIAIIDPSLMTSLPAKMVAATGMDAFTHALEAYVSVKADPISEAISLYAMELIAKNLRQAVHSQDNKENIAKMAIASTMGGIALNMPMLGLVHALSTPLGGIYNVPHGIGNALLLPYVMKYNLVSCPEKFAKVAQIMGEKIDGLTTLEAAEKAFRAVVKLSTDVGIPTTIKDLGLDLSRLDKLAEDAMKSYNCQMNPRKNTIEDVKQLYIDAYEGNL